MRAPCIVCGRRRGHDREEHERYRREYYRTKNLLRRNFPRLAGLAKVLDFYRRTDPPAPTPEPRPLDWSVKVLPGGTVVHLPIWPEGDPTP